jgi:endonuclease/exonuclease/phosphatase family metal-dependent hydrolase
LPENSDHITVATYNVHQWQGIDGIYNPRRVMQVVRELNADVIALQEITIPWGNNPQNIDMDYYLKFGGNRAIFGLTFLKNKAHFGNVLLTSFPAVAIRRLDLSVKHREPRSAIDADLEVNGRRIRVIATHLGVAGYERRRQLRTLISILNKENRNRTDLTILMGDFNLWSVHSPLLARLRRLFGPSPYLRTYPSRFPIFPLDRIWVKPNGFLKTVAVHNSNTARVASDHLPVKGTIHF